MNQETELPPLPDALGQIEYPAQPYEPAWVSTAGAYDEGQMVEYGKSCAAAARAKALKDVKAELERELIKLGGMGMYIQGAGIRLGIDALNKLKDEE